MTSTTRKFVASAAAALTLGAAGAAIAVEPAQAVIGRWFGHHHAADKSIKVARGYYGEGDTRVIAPGGNWSNVRSVRLHGYGCTTIVMQSRYGYWPQKFDDRRRWLNVNSEHVMTHIKCP